MNDDDTIYRDARGRWVDGDFSDTDMPELERGDPPPSDEVAYEPFPEGWTPNGAVGVASLLKRLLARLGGRRFDEFDYVPTIKNRILYRLMRHCNTMRVQAPMLDYAAHVCSDGVVREDWKCAACCRCWQCKGTREDIEREGIDATDIEAVKAVALRRLVMTPATPRMPGVTWPFDPSDEEVA